VNDTNFWATEPDIDTPKKGRMAPKRVLEAKGGKRSGVIQAAFAGQDPHGKAIMTETRTLIFYAGPLMRTIDQEIRTDPIEKLTIADTKEGTLGIRLARSMTEDKGGRMVNAGGAETEKQVWGKALTMGRLLRTGGRSDRRRCHLR
jgi:hypothetical protein